MPTFSECMIVCDINILDLLIRWKKKKGEKGVESGGADIDSVSSTTFLLILQPFQISVLHLLFFINSHSMLQTSSKYHNYQTSLPS